METNRSDIETAVTQLVRKLVGMPDSQPIRVDADLKTDLGFDSLLEAEFGMEIEDRFEVQVPDGVRPRNVREVVDLILAAKTKSEMYRS